MKRGSLLLLALCLTVCSIFHLAGCGSNGPETSGIPSGSGYRISLSTSLTTVPLGGTTVIQALVIDGKGTPIADKERVMFSSNVGGTFEGGIDASNSETNEGVAAIVYRAPMKNTDKPSPPKMETISAAYGGAVSSIEILLGI